MDHVVGEVQGHFIQRKIGVLDLLREHDVAVAIAARKRSGSVGTSSVVTPKPANGGQGKTGQREEAGD